MKRFLTNRRYYPLAALLLAAPFWLGGRAPDASPAAGGGHSPVCVIEGAFEYVCQGSTTLIPLDASSSFSPDGLPLSFEWTSGCASSSFDDAASPTPVLFVDTSQACDMGCWVRLRVFDGTNYSFCRFHVTIVGSRELDLDIKPGSCPNPLKIGNQGALPVSLLGTDSFDPATVILSSVRLVRADGVGGEVAPHMHSFEDTGTPFAGELCDCHDLEGDGIIDLSLKFPVRSVVTTLQLDQGLAGLVRLRLVGELTNGEPFHAEDCVRVMP